MIREAYEEVGICIAPDALKVTHVMHRKSNRFNVDIFFECVDWDGDVVNREPEKCAGLEYFPLEELPSNTIDYIKDALRAISNGIFYSESGW